MTNKELTLKDELANGLQEGMYCRGAFLGCEEPIASKKTPGQFFYNINVLVGDFTQQFGIDAVNYGVLKEKQRLTPIFIKYREFRFSNGGSKKDIEEVTVL